MFTYIIYINVIHFFLIMDINILKWVLNILIVPLMTISLSMIIDGNIIGIIFFIELILMSAIINGDNKHN